MQLLSFRVRNYRSILDSGEIKAARITALLGRNESGKTNLLRALASLNPPGGIVALSAIKDFPRNRRLDECEPTTPVVDTKWELTENEAADLRKIWPRAEVTSPISVNRGYADSHWFVIPAAPLDFDPQNVFSKVKKTALAVKAAARKLKEEEKATLEAAADTFSRTAKPVSDPKVWAKAMEAAEEALGIALATVNAELTDEQDEVLSDLGHLAGDILNDDRAQKEAENWILQNLPHFVYLMEYPEIKGQQNIRDFLDRKKNNIETDADINFEKMCKVAGLDPARLQQLGNANIEDRNQLANRASAEISGKLARLWTDRKLKVRFNPDGDHLATMVSEVSDYYDVEVSLDERSRGFQWFFGFHIVFSADTQDGDKDSAILLLDEPGLYLHAKAQGDLLRYLEDEFRNQILYTTHSPFMVPTHRLDCVRTVSFDVDNGTTVTNDPTGDARTLFPLKTALGYDLSQSLFFFGGHNLVVETVTDYWFLSAASEFLSANGGSGLDSRLTLTPTGGAHKVPYMVALLASEKLDAMVLLSHEKAATTTGEDLVKNKFFEGRSVLSIGDAYQDNSRPAEADVEDLLDADIYETLVRESYSNELMGKSLKINYRIPRAVKRMEQAFKEIGLKFHRMRPARLFLQRMGADPDTVMSQGAIDRFGQLFTLVNERFDQHVGRNGNPFDYGQDP